MIIRHTKTKKSLLKPVFIAVAFAMIVGTIFMAIDIATSGAEITNLENEIYALEVTKRALTQDVIRHSSVSASAEGSEALGFTKSTNTVYLTLDALESAYVR